MLNKIGPGRESGHWAKAGGLDWIISPGPFQPKPFCDSVSLDDCSACVQMPCTADLAEALLRRSGLGRNPLSSCWRQYSDEQSLPGQMWMGIKGRGGGEGFWALFPSFPTENTHSRITIIWTICKIKKFQEHCYIGGLQAKLKILLENKAWHQLEFIIQWKSISGNSNGSAKHCGSSSYSTRFVQEKVSAIEEPKQTAVE